MKSLNFIVYMTLVLLMILNVFQAERISELNKKINATRTELELSIGERVSHDDLNHQSDRLEERIGSLEHSLDEIQFLVGQKGNR